MPRSSGDWAAIPFQNPVGDQLKGERVRRAVFQEEISRHVVMTRLPFLPETDGVVSVGALQVRGADDAELMFDWFEASREVEPMAKPAEIDVRYGKRRQVEVSNDFRNIEGAAVVGGDERKRQKIVRKFRRRIRVRRFRYR